MTKKTTLDELGAMMEHVINYMTENMATKEDTADIRRDMATKDQVISLHMQVNSIETQLRGMNHGKLEGRVENLEQEVFGKVRR